MKIRINTDAETAQYLIEKNRLFTTQFHSASNDGEVAIDVTFPPSADAEIIAKAFFIAGQDYAMQQVQKIFNYENSLPTEPA